MDKQELIQKVKSLESFNSVYAKDFEWGFDECRNGVLSLIQALEEPQNENHLHDIKSQIEYLLEHGPGKNKSLNMLRNMVDNMIQGNWALARVREEKVKVPAFVAGWIEWCKNRKWAISNVVMADNIKYFEDHNEPTGLLDWYIEKGNDAILARAWLDGYEVEEEPKWVVKVGKLYFCGWEDTTAQFVLNTTLGEDESIIKYEKEGTASSVAKNLGGTVEPVEG